MSKRMQLGNIGANKITSLHAKSIKNFFPKAKVHSIADPNPSDSARDWSIEYDIGKTSPDYTDIQKIWILIYFFCLLNDTHAKINIVLLLFNGWICHFVYDHTAFQFSTDSRFMFPE